MSDLHTIDVAEIVAACRAELEQTIAAFNSAFDTTFRADVGEPEMLGITSAPFVGPGLLVLFNAGPTAVIVTVPDSSGLLPAWVAAPDADGVSKLDALGQELSKSLLPGGLTVEGTSAMHVADLSAALVSAVPTPEARQIPITLHTADGRSGPLTICTPFTAGMQAFSAPAPTAAELAEEEREGPAGVLRGDEAAAAIEEAERQRAAKSLDVLPAYSRSLLKVRVPVTVTLARKKQRISQIIELGPGSIIQFTKACDQLLELEVNGHTVGEGEAVKVGEKFGLRVTGMVLPGEKFKPVPGKRTA